MLVCSSSYLSSVYCITKYVFPLSICITIIGNRFRILIDTQHDIDIFSPRTTSSALALPIIDSHEYVPAKENDDELVLIISVDVFLFSIAIEKFALIHPLRVLQICSGALYSEELDMANIHRMFLPKEHVIFVRYPARITWFCGNSTTETRNYK